MAQCPSGVSLGVGVGMLALSLTSDKTREFILSADEGVKRSARLGAEAPIIRYGGMARVTTSRMQPKPSVTCEGTITLLSSDVP